MITETEIISDLKNLMAKVELMAVTYKNNEIWNDIDEELGNILSTLQKDKRIYGY